MRGGTVSDATTWWGIVGNTTNSGADIGSRLQLNSISEYRSSEYGGKNSDGYHCDQTSLICLTISFWYDWTRHVGEER